MGPKRKCIHGFSGQKKIHYCSTLQKCFYSWWNSPVQNSSSTKVIVAYKMFCSINIETCFLRANPELFFLYLLRLKSCPSSLKNFRTFVLAWFPIFCKIIVNVKVDFELQLFNPRGSNHSIDAFHSRFHKGWTLIIIGDDWSF